MREHGTSGRGDELVPEKAGRLVTDIEEDDRGREEGRDQRNENSKGDRGLFEGDRDGGDENAGERERSRDET